MTRPTARVLALLELLQSGGTRTVAELAGRLEVDERTVRRYTDHLLDLGVPVESVRGRYGGYRLAPGYRLPPLMLSDDEALAVLLGLVVARRSGWLPAAAPGTGTATGTGTTPDTAAGTAAETAAAKIRRVLPERLGRRLDVLLDAVAFTPARPEPTPPPETGVLLSIADAVRHRRPVSIRYVSGDGRRSERTLHPYGLVTHADRWYVTGADPGLGEDRTFRLDRIADARILPGSFEPRPGFDPARQVLTGLATAPYRHHVILRIQASVERIRTRLPDSVALIEELPPAVGTDPGSSPRCDPGIGPDPDPYADPDPGPDLGTGTGTGTEPWCRVELRAERLDWVPPVLASLDRPFLVERPDELRDLVAALADRLAASARRGAALLAFDDHELVLVLVAEEEDQRHAAFPAHHLGVHVDALARELGVVGRRVGGVEGNTGLPAGLVVALRRHQGQDRSPAGRGHLHPPGTTAERRVYRQRAAENLRIERDRLVLIGHRHDHVAHPRQLRHRWLPFLLPVPG